MKCCTLQYYPVLLNPKQEELEDTEVEGIHPKKQPGKWLT